MKKSNATFLTRRELRLFEDMYQALKVFPGFRMANVFCYETREYFGVHRQCARKIQKELGSKGSKLNVAAHEAGHAIVITGTHRRIKEAVIISAEDGGYFGHVKPINCVDGDDNEPIEIAPQLTKADTHIEMLTKSSGFVAEHMFTNRISRAYHEKFLTYVQSRYLDERDNTRSLHHWNFFMGWCAHILRKNERLLHIIIEDLLKHGGLTLAAKDRLHIEVKKEPVELFFN